LDCTEKAKSDPHTHTHTDDLIWSPKHWGEKKTKLKIDFHKYTSLSQILFSLKPCPA